MKRKRVLLGILVLAAVGAAVGFFGPFRKHPEELRLQGIVEIQEVRLGSKIGGRVAEVFVREGEVVPANKLLVRFDAPELEAQAKQLYAQVEANRAAMDRARNGPRPQEVEAGRPPTRPPRPGWTKC